MSFSVAATIGFEETTYTAMEEDGLVEVVVAVLEGNLSRSVVVKLETVDGTARSKLLQLV